MSRFLSMLPAGYVDTIIAKPGWCTRRWTPPSTAPTRLCRTAPRLWCRRWSPTSGWIWPSRRAGERACRCASSGHGPEAARLRGLAGSGVEFLGTLSDADVRASYRRSSVVLLPGEEDFGIVPLEAQACGRPVVALGRGGALETVVDGVTGVLVPDPAVDAFADGIVRALGIGFDAAGIRRHAESFGRERFATQMTAVVADTLGRSSGSRPW